MSAASANNNFSEAERALIEKLPTNGQLVKAWTPEEVVMGSVALDLATWIKGVWYCNKAHSRPINEDIQPNNRCNEGIHANWSLESIWTYMLNNDIACNRKIGPDDKQSFPSVTSFYGVTSRGKLGPGLSALVVEFQDLFYRWR